MSRTQRPTADDVILDLLVEGVEPSHENLVAAIAAYPEHRQALEDFFASFAVQTAIGAAAPSAGFPAERFANLGVSHILGLRHRRVSMARERQAAAAPTMRLSQLLKQHGLTEATIAMRAGLDEGLVTKLDYRRIRVPWPAELSRRLGEALEIPPAHVIAAATGPPIPSSRGNLRKAKGPIQVRSESFEEAITASTLSAEQKAYWLSLPVEEVDPRV
jgi:hypothetical protein